MAKKRTSFTRVRTGASNVTLSPAWISYRSFGSPKSPSPSLVSREVDVLLGRSADVVAGDRLTNSDLNLFVFQVTQGPADKTAIALEITTDTITRIRVSVANLALSVMWWANESSGYTSDLQTGSLLDLRFQRGVDVVPGDKLTNGTLSKSYYVFEVIDEQLTSIALCKEITSKTLTRVRENASDLTVDVVWFEGKPSGASSVIYQGAEIPISAQIRFPSTFDVQVGDVFKDDENNLVFYIYQIVPELTTLIALCQEAPVFVDDEFSDSVIGSFWTEETPGTWNEALTAGALDLDAADLDTPFKLDEAAFLYQSLFTGDFDVWCLIGVVGTAYADPSERIVGFVRARLSTGASVAVGVAVDSNSSNFYVVADGGTGITGTIGAATGATTYIRLKRVGSAFTFYYAGPSEPTAEASWTALTAPSSPVVVGSGAVRVGIGGYIIVPGAPPAAEDIHFYHIRRWVVGTSLVDSIATRYVSGTALSGTKDGINKTFTFPESISASSESVWWNGGLQVRGDDYTISGTTLTFAAGHPAPSSGDTLIANYLSA